MKVSKIFSGFLKKYCRQISDVTNSNALNSVKNGDEVSVFRTITNDDINNFAKLTNDFNPIHFNSPKNLVHGAFLNGLVSGVLGTKIPGPGTILVQENLTFPKPCYAGDTVEIKVHVVSVRKIIKCEFTCIANGENVVLKGDAKLLKKS